MAYEDAVWLDVLPNMSQFGAEMSKGADSAAGKAGKSSGKKFGLAMAAGVAVVAGAAVAGGKALYDLGSTFDNMADTIRVGTGATGDALEGMVASAKNVATQIPAEMEDIGTAVADINTRMGLTGPVLEDFTSKFLEAGRITGEALDVNAISSSFAVFGVEGEEASTAMDTLYRVAQDTGIGINDLSNTISKAGPSIQALGFDFEQTAAMVGGLDKAGLDASRMTAGLGRALVELAKEGEDPAKTFERVTGEIQAMSDAGDVAGATDMSAKLFGTRNAPAFMQALKEGKLNLEDLTAAATGSGDTIMEASEETADFSEQWQLFKNRLSVAIAPAAEGLFDLISSGMEWINEKAIPYIEKFTSSWEEGTGPVGQVKDVLGAVWDVIQTYVLPALEQLWGVLQDHVFPWFMTVAGVVRDTLGPVFADLWRIFNEKVLPALNDMWAFIQEHVIPTISYLANDIVLPLFKLIGSAIQTVWTNVISPALSSFYDFLKNYVGPAVSWLWTEVIDPTFKWIGGAIKAFGDNWADVWHGIQSAALAPVNFVIDVIYNQGIRKVLNLIPGVDLAEAQTINTPPVARRGSSGSGRSNVRPLVAFQDGGYVDLPWDARSRDPYLGLAPNGMFKFEGEEYIVKRSSTDKLQKNHPGLLDYINRHGSLPEHAGGGRVRLRGHSFTSTFAAAILAAEQAIGKTFRITQGGFRPRTSYSGTSHAGDAVDIARPYGTRDIVSLRSQGIAAWDRAGKGNWIDHIHGVPLPGFGSPAGSAVWQAQDYLRGGDGLGGRDNGPRVGVSGEAGGGWFQIPGMIKEIIANMNKMTSPWGEMFKGAVEHSVEKLQGWIGGKLDELGTGLADLIFRRNTGDEVGANGYLTGTGWADPGLAYLSEDGMPELVVGPQLRNMQGGERVYSHAATRKLLGGAGEGRFVSGRLRIDEDGTAWVEGIVEDMLEDRDSSADRWNRMGV